MPYAEHPRLSRIWNSMMRRCYNPVDTSYFRYGMRGITVCKSWHDRRMFIAWALTHGYEDHLTIERKNNDRGYEPRNCCFATAGQQARNRRSNINIAAFGVVKNLISWSEDIRCVVNHATLTARFHRGKMNAEEMITTPAGQCKCTKQAPLYKAYGRKQTFKQWANQYGIKRTTLQARMIVYGRTLEEALSMGPANAKH
jgi:hypothetical protein